MVRFSGSFVGDGKLMGTQSAQNSAGIQTLLDVRLVSSFYRLRGWREVLDGRFTDVDIG
jgi:hypothetical protein